MTKKKQKKKIDEKRLMIKFLACTAYLIVIMILFVCSYKLFQAKSDITEWGKVESTEQYSYIEISKMSEKFAYYEEENIGIHFVIETSETGEWRTYLIAIDEDNYDKYKDIIDYSYERTEEVPKTIKVYGYPVLISDELKQMALNNIGNFLPADNEVEITAENFEEYLTNCYLDTTQSRKEYFNLILFATLILLFIMVGLLIFTIFDRDKIVDNLDDVIAATVKSTKKKLNSVKQLTTKETTKQSTKDDKNKTQDKDKKTPKKALKTKKEQPKKVIKEESKKEVKIEPKKESKTEPKKEIKTEPKKVIKQEYDEEEEII